MAGKTPRVLVTPTQDLGKVLNSMHDMALEGEPKLASAVQIAQLALKHRQNKNQRQRIVLFVGSPITETKVQALQSRASAVTLGHTAHILLQRPQEGVATFCFVTTNALICHRHVKDACRLSCSSLLLLSSANALRCACRPPSCYVVLSLCLPPSRSQEELVKIGKKLKKNNVAVDVVNFGAAEVNGERLEAFIEAVNSGDNSHLVSVPTGTILSDTLFGSPIYQQVGLAST